MDVALLPGAERIAALQAEERQQKDNLCGCFWASLVLRAHGFSEVDQDDVAIRAGSLLPHPSDEDVPPGASPRQDYRLPIPVVDDHDVTGTGEPGLARAIAELSEGALAAVPVAGPWTAGSVLALFAAAEEHGASLVANVRTGCFWGSRAPVSSLLEALAGRVADGPPPDWDVGHFVTFAGLVRGPGGSLVLVGDTYQELGWRGYYLQPALAVAAALERGDGREGGVLCVCPAAAEEALRARLAAAGFDLRHWDNGTPDREQER
jgi:hypothetical protein